MRKVLFFLGELTDQDIDWLITTGQRQEIPLATTLITEGKTVDTLYIVLDGELIVSTAAMGGKEVARLGSGEVVGEMSFVDSRPPSATVTADEEAVVFAIPRALLAEKLHQDDGFAARFYRALAAFLSSRLRTTVGQLGYEKSGVSSGTSDGTEVLSASAQAMLERLEWLLQRLRTA